MNDLELLRRYCETASEDAFRQLVDRHLGMVYAVALRQVRNPDWADEVAHAVFIALARKADRFLNALCSQVGFIARRFCRR